MKEYLPELSDIYIIIFSSMLQHCKTQNHPVNRKNVSVIDNRNNKSVPKLLDSFHILQKHASLNANKIATPLNIIP